MAIHVIKYGNLDPHTGCMNCGLLKVMSSIYYSEAGEPLIAPLAEQFDPGAFVRFVQVGSDPIAFIRYSYCSRSCFEENYDSLPGEPYSRPAVGTYPNVESFRMSQNLSRKILNLSS